MNPLFTSANGLLQALETVDPPEYDGEDPKRDALLLRVLMNEAPTEEGKTTIAEDIVDSVRANDRDVKSLKSLSNYWQASLLRPMTQLFRLAIPHPSRDEDEVYRDIEPTNRSSSIKATVLRRDGYRCPISGIFDDRVWEDAPHLIDETESPPPVSGPTQCSHTIPYSYNEFRERHPSQTLRVSAWGALLRFSGWEDLITELQGKGINITDNCITMEAGVHARFGAMKGWLEAEEAEGPDIYRWKLRNARTDRLAQVPGFEPLVDLTPKIAGYNPPSPRLLLLHASVARVIKLSGRGEELIKIWREFYDSETLSTDGTSHQLLHHCIDMAQLRRLGMEGSEVEGELPAIKEVVTERGGNLVP